MKIILIPFAGGTKYSYDFFKKYFDDSFHLVTLELPGHGSRIREPLLDNLKDIVSDLYINNLNEFRDHYILFGHSMGAIIAFLLAEKLSINRRLKAPTHLVLSSHGSIDILAKRNFERYKLGFSDFKKLVKCFGGIPEEILNHKEAYLMFEKILRADFKALDTYNREKHLKLNIPITAICSDNDICTLEELQSWEKYTNKEFKTYYFKGEHFYLFDNAKDVAMILTKIANKINKSE